MQVPHNPHEGIELNENQVTASDFETVERIQVDTVGKGPGGLQELPAAPGIRPLFCNEHKSAVENHPYRGVPSRLIDRRSDLREGVIASPLGMAACLSLAANDEDASSN